MAAEVRYTAEFINTATGEPILRVGRTQTVVNVGAGADDSAAIEQHGAMCIAVAQTFSSDITKEFCEQLNEHCETLAAAARREAGA